MTDPPTSTRPPRGSASAPPAPSAAEPDEPGPLPAAELRRGRPSLAWLVPVAAVVLAGWLGLRAWSERGVEVTVHLAEGHGLKAGDEIRYRGIAVGDVRDVLVADDLSGVVVSGRLHSHAGRIARAGSRFWVVRPRLDLEGVAGLETLVGPRYLTVLPGSGPRQRSFIGLDEPPPVDVVEPGDLEVMLEAPTRGGLQDGAPVLYRELRVGTVISVALASDAGSVEARVHIEKAYAQLITPRTRFWRRQGVEASVGLRGISVEVNSLRALLVGGVALATPPDSGGPVLTGHRFPLADKPQEGWLEWEPLVAVGSGLLPPGAPVPAPLRATVGWRQGWLIKGQRSRQGWVLPTEEGLLGPEDLLVPSEGVDGASVVLEVAGASVALSGSPLWTRGGLAMLQVAIDGESTPWPRDRIRAAEAPEDCLIFADPGAAPLPLAAPRLTATGTGRWSIDAALALDDRWHGACVLARSDGRLLGLLCIGDETTVVGLISPEPKSGS